MSNAEVGVQRKGKRYSCIYGYGATEFKSGDSWVYDFSCNVLTVKGGTSATVEIEGPGENDDKKYFLTVWKVGTEMHYLDYVG